MKKFKIGVIADSFRLGFDESIKKAKELGLDGVQLYAAYGDISPELDFRERKEILKKIRETGLEICALCGDLGGHGFENASENPEKIKKSKQIADLACDFETNIVTTHIGVVPENEFCEKYKIMQQACFELAEYAHSKGVAFAVETGPEPAKRLRKFLDGISSKGIAVNFDPANLVMVTGDDPVRAVRELGKYIVHTHAKDGVMLKKTDPQIIYDFFAQGGIGDLRLEEYFKETPLGNGEVDFDGYLAALENAGYSGYLTIERETGENPELDIKVAAEFLKNHI